MKRLQVEFEDNDLAWITMDYASLYFKKSKKDLAREMIQQKVEEMLEKNTDIKDSVDALLKKLNENFSG